MEFPIYFAPNSSFWFTNQETKLPLCWLCNSFPRTGDQALLLLPDFRIWGGGTALILESVRGEQGMTEVALPSNRHSGSELLNFLSLNS